MSDETLSAITQEEYRTLLLADDKRVKYQFVEFPEAKQGERWRCRRCGVIAQATIIAHPIWDGPFDGAGRGACDYREIPYCRSCDGEKPEWENGQPIRIPAFPGQSVLVMARLSDCLHRQDLHPLLVGRAKKQPPALQE